MHAGRIDTLHTGSLTADVVVCGAGPAGVCAALTATREGASVATSAR